MDFIVTVRTYTGAVKSVDVKNMPNEEIIVSYVPAEDTSMGTCSSNRI